MSLEELCQGRIKEDFDMDVRVQHVRLLDQNEIDRDLNLIAVEATFIDKDGCPGQAAITFNAPEIHSVTNTPVVPLLPAGVQIMGMLM